MPKHVDPDTRYPAHFAVRKAVASGTLPRITTRVCVECGQGAHAYHHHQGYDEEHWLDVVPYCRRHHKLEDARLKAHEKRNAIPQPKPAPSATPTMQEEAPLTVREVAERLRVKEGTVRRWLHSGKLRGTFLGGQTGYRILPSEVRRFEREGPATPPPGAAEPTEREEG